MNLNIQPPGRNSSTHQTPLLRLCLKLKNLYNNENLLRQLFSFLFFCLCHFFLYPLHYISPSFPKFFFPISFLSFLSSILLSSPFHFNFILHYILPFQLVSLLSQSITQTPGSKKTPVSSLSTLSPSPAGLGGRSPTLTTNTGNI